MVDAFGLSWCDQYSSDEKAGVAMFGLRQIELPPPMVVVEQAPPVTPAEERTETKGKRVFAIPACPDDLVRVTDVEGEVWTRGERSRRNRWTSADGREIVDWHRLVVSYGPVEER
jgi:hypothetical protein